MQYLHSHQIIHFDIKVSMQLLIVLAYVFSSSAWPMASESCPKQVTLASQHLTNYVQRQHYQPALYTGACLAQLLLFILFNSGLKAAFDESGCTNSYLHSS